MVVTDLHGDGGAFQRYIRRFRRLHATGDVQRLILLGDLIHGYGPPHTDASLDMILQVLDLRDEFGPENVIMLLGNHEMPHIYGVSLSKGSMTFTPRFEHALGDHRVRVMALLESLPLYIRTAAGVLLSHAGPAAEVIDQVNRLRHFDHRALLANADDVLAQAPDLAPLYRQYSTVYGTSYAEDAHELLAIQGADDPRYAELLRGFIISQQSESFRLLWDALFTQNERNMSDTEYLHVCEDFLDAFSEGAPGPQRVVVSGHIVTPGGGYKVINRYHLRLASAAHARPVTAGLYLRLDCAQPMHSAIDLMHRLDSVFVDNEED